MRVSTLKKRLKKRYKGSKNRVAYKVLVDFLYSECKTYRVFKNEIRPTDSSKRGVVCYKNDIEDLLNLLGIKFEAKNIAPRGGASGNRIAITHNIDMSC